MVVMVTFCVLSTLTFSNIFYVHHLIVSCNDIGLGL